MKKLVFFLFVFAITANAIAQYKFKGIDVFTGAGQSSNPMNIINAGGKIFFTATTTNFGRELYTVKAPFNAETLVSDIAPGTFNSDPADFIEFDGKLFFTADDHGLGREMWVSDGTTAGTQMVKDILLGGVSSNPHGFCVSNGKLYFVATTITEGEELWVTDGTLNGTVMVKDIRTGNNSSGITNLYDFNGTLYFGADDGIVGAELWMSDGTASGTVMVKDINTGLPPSNPLMFTAFNGKVYFVASKAGLGEELWVTDGTSTGTSIVVDLSVGPAIGVMSINRFMFVFNNAIYFNGGNSLTTGTELYKSDGTSGGTVLVKEMTTGAGGTLLSWPCIIGNKLYYTADVFTTGKELWVSDGTTAGTQMVVEINAGATSSKPSNQIAFNNKLFFAADSGLLASQVFYSDGTASGTAMIRPSGGLADALSLGGFSGFAKLDSMLFFAANYDTKGAELWYLKDTSSSSSVHSIKIQDDVSIYPNPNNGTFTLQLGDNNFQNGRVTIYDMMGRESFKSQITNYPSQITLDQPKGIYMVKVQLDDAVFTKRILIE